MKKTLTVIGLALALVASVINSQAQTFGISATGTTNGATGITNLSWLILPPPTQGAWESTYVNASMAAAGTGVIRWYANGTNYTVRTSGVVSTNQVATDTNSLATGDIVIYKHKNADNTLTLRRTVVHAPVTSVSVVFTNALGFIPSAGDTITKETLQGTLNITTAVKELNGSWLYGDPGKPLLVEAYDSTNFVWLNAVSARTR